MGVSLGAIGLRLIGCCCLLYGGFISGDDRTAMYTLLSTCTYLVSISRKLRISYGATALFIWAAGFAKGGHGEYSGDIWFTAFGSTLSLFGVLALFSGQLKEILRLRPVQQDSWRLLG